MKNKFVNKYNEKSLNGLSSHISDKSDDYSLSGLASHRGNKQTPKTTDSSSKKGK